MAVTNTLPAVLAALKASTSPSNSRAEPPTLSLMNLPLEIRHMIFERFCVRDGIETKHIMRRWFEVKDVKEQIAKGAKGIAKLGYGADGEIKYWDDENLDEEYDDEDKEDEAGDGNDDEDDDEDEEDDGEDQDKDEEEEDADDMAEAIAAVQQPIIRPATKWHHVSKFLRITQAPPSVDLFLIEKELGSQIKAWFYDTAVLKVDVTASFAHSSFFELALEDLASATCTPMANIKKAELTVVWDTTWEKLPNNEYGIVFPVMLDTRSNFVMDILLRAPELFQVAIHWYDTENDTDSQILMNKICTKFTTLKDNVSIEQHLIANNLKPSSRSILGKRRREFQDIVDMRRDVF